MKAWIAKYVETYKVTKSDKYAETEVGINFCFKCENVLKWCIYIGPRLIHIHTSAIPTYFSLHSPLLVGVSILP